MITTAIGVYGISLGVGGFFKGILNWPQRIIALLGGLGVIFNTGIIVAAGGVVLIGVTILWQLFKGERL